MPRAKNGSLTKIGVVWQKSDFWTKNQNFGPKKEAHSFTLTMFWPQTEKVVQRKSCLFSNKYKSLKKCWVFFWVKMHFQPKNHFWAERKNGRYTLRVSVLFDYPLLLRLALPNTLHARISFGESYVHISMRSFWYCLCAESFEEIYAWGISSSIA